jgi:enoyl-CoA hydratase/carnithine racemase
MGEILTELSGSILRVQFNRPAKKNAMTLAMYAGLADQLDQADKNDRVQVVLVHGAGDSFTAGNDLADFVSHPPGPGDSPQARFLDALIRFSKPLVAAVHGVAIGGGTTMLMHFDFVYAAQSTKFQVPFINLALVPEMGSSYTLPRQLGYLQSTELIFLGAPFNAARAHELGLVTAVVPDQDVLATANQTATKLAEKPSCALRACKKLMKDPERENLKQAVSREMSEFAARVRSAEAKEAFTAFLEKRPPDFTRTTQVAASVFGHEPAL